MSFTGGLIPALHFAQIQYKIMSHRSNNIQESEPALYWLSMPEANEPESTPGVYHDDFNVVSGNGFKGPE